MLKYFNFMIKEPFFYSLIMLKSSSKLVFSCLNSKDIFFMLTLSIYGIILRGLKSVFFLYYLQFQGYCSLQFEVAIIYILTKRSLFMVL